MTSAADVDKVRDKLKLAVASGFDNAIDRYLEEFEQIVAARAREEGAREERELQRRILDRLPLEVMGQVVMAAAEEMSTAWDEARTHLGLPRRAEGQP
jgi:hypothetical protein